jgi:hypothetical protein
MEIEVSARGDLQITPTIVYCVVHSFGPKMLETMRGGMREDLNENL